MHRVVLCAVLVLSLLALRASAQCSFTTNGVTYDFSGLTVASGGADYLVTDSAGQYTYEFNVCGAIVNQNLGSCNTNNAMICQTDQSHNPVSTVAQYSPSALSWSLAGTTPSQGIKVGTSNGDICFPTSNPRTASITFTCSTQTVGTLSVSTSGTPPCNYQITFPTSYACSGGGGGGGGGSGGGKGGLSGGWIFFIIVIVTFTVYIIGGCIWNHRKDPNTSLKEKCPNAGFWALLPGLVKDGCGFTFRGIKNCFGKLTGGGSYEKV